MIDGEFTVLNDKKKTTKERLKEAEDRIWELLFVQSKLITENVQKEQRIQELQKMVGSLDEPIEPLDWESWETGLLEEE